MLLTGLTFLALQLTTQLEADDLKFHVQLATSARGELALVERLKNLRNVTEKLPENWRSEAKRDGSIDGDKVLTKTALLKEIEGMELTAAERWALIVENTALIDISKSKLDTRATAMRKQIEELPRLHLDLNSKLDAFNKRMKDGILFNLANRLSN